MWELLEGRDKAVAGTTCKYLQFLISHLRNTTNQLILVQYMHVIKPCLSSLTCHLVFVSDKSLKETLDKVLLSGYFDRAQTHQNGTCEEEEEKEDQTVVAETKAVKQPSEPGN